MKGLKINEKRPGLAHFFKQRSGAEMDHSEWMLQVTWLVLTKLTALFQHAIGIAKQ